MKLIRRHRAWNGPPPTAYPYVADVRTFDIPVTIARCIRGLPQNCVAITLRPMGGETMTSMAERSARHKGIRILWVPRRAALKGGMVSPRINEQQAMG